MTAGTARAVAAGSEAASTDATAWSSDGVETPDKYVSLYEPGAVEDLRFRFMRRLVVSARRWRSFVDQNLKRGAQTQARWETLLCISISREATQGEIARMVSVEDPTVARMLNTLEKEGQVRRVVANADRRRRLVRLTPEGEQTLAAMQVVIDGLRDAVLQDLDSEEIAVGMRILDKVMARLEVA